MAKKIYEEENIRGIATAIREKTSEDRTYKISDMPEGINEVYEAGRSLEYDRFWDSFQQNGKRTIYCFSFGSGWTAETLKPKYDLRPTNAYMMFHNNMDQYILIDDFVDHCNNLGIVLDTSNCTNFSYAFTQLKTSHLGTIDLSNATSGTSNMLYNNKHIKTIDECIISEKTSIHSTTFEGATNLENITFKGIIVKNLNLKNNSKLTKNSIISAVNCLSDTTNNLTASFSVSAVNKSFETSLDANDGSLSEEWLAIVESKPNWNIEIV